MRNSRYSFNSSGTPLSTIHSQQVVNYSGAIVTVIDVVPKPVTVNVSIEVLKTYLYRRASVGTIFREWNYDRPQETLRI
jgi:hypothetical protein